MSVEGDVDKLCHQWITEYDCWRIWSEFAKSGAVDDRVRENAVFHCSTYPENSGDRKIHDCRLLIQFICKIADATKEMSEDVPTESQHDDVTPRETTLEEAIELLDYISNAFTRLEYGELREVKLCLKHFAVLVPLYKGD